MLVEAFIQTRTDRHIAAARVAIAAFALAAVWIDRSKPGSAPDLAFGLLVAYLAFSGGLLVASRRERVRSAEIALGSHLVDLLVFATLMYLTEGLTSPFFLLFTFSLLSATFRWQSKGVLWTAVAVLILLVAITWVYRGLDPGLPFPVEQLMIRCAHVVVIGAMLVYVGSRQQRSADEVARLAAWQPDAALGADSRSFLAACLAHVANVFDAPRVVLVLQTREEPGASVSIWEDGVFHQDRLAAEPLETIVPEALAESGFIRRAAGDVLVADERGRLSHWRGSLLSPALAGYSLEQVLSVPINSEHATGRLFVADKQDVVREELALAWVVAVQIGLGLDRVQVIEAAQQSAATEERLRLARDLHDGILQTLAGTALQLETVKRLADQDPASVRPKIDDMQSWLLSEQREMREFIGRLRPAGLPAHPGRDEDHAGLPALVQALEQQWGVAITAPTEAAHLVVSTGMEFQLRHIVREAVANAVRHGGASQISVQAKVDDGALRLAIIDNGRGLPVHGQFDERQCAQGRIGPQSLRERIVGLGGSLLIDSTPAGVTLSIQLPLRSTDARDSDRPDCR